MQECHPSIDFSQESLQRSLQLLRQAAAILPAEMDQPAALQEESDLDGQVSIQTHLSQVALSLESWKRALAGSSKSWSGRGAAMHSADKMLRYLRFAWYAGSTNRLDVVLKHGITASMDPLIANGVLRCLSEKGKVPSKASLKRYRLVLDIAHLLLSQED